MHPTRRDVLTGLAGTAGLASLAGAAGPAAHASPPAAKKPAVVTRAITEGFWSAGGFGAGTLVGTVDADGLRMLATIGTRGYLDPYQPGAGTVTYDYAYWDSPWVSTPYGWTELIPSWNVETPPGSWVEILARGVDARGAVTDWFVTGRWCADAPAQGGAITRTSVDGQRTSMASVATDTIVAGAGRAFTGWQVRIVLLRRPGVAAPSPVVRLLGAVASAVPSGTTTEPTSAFGGTVTTLAVPTLSQERHLGHYAQWGGGGEAWCSATSTAMVVDYYGKGPTASETAWVSPAIDPQVDLTARQVYDAAYDGTGNWPFNTAYAATRGLTGYVTRLRDFAAAEPFLAAGIPLIISVSFSASELTGAGYSTDGHLMVLVGFTAQGYPIVNDPASQLVADNGRVRLIYYRDQLERVWSRSGRTAYVIRPAPPTTPVTVTVPPGAPYRPDPDWTRRRVRG